MGDNPYSVKNRTIRAESLGYTTKSKEEIFTQSKEKRIHESMVPAKALLRESRDSETHPNSFPIIFALDVTGSMLEIPLHLVQEGLPQIMAGIMQVGVPDPAILFLAIGDHECDNFPLQVGQFESGDEQLDMWLTRTFLEGKGGGNAGESYSLAWYFASHHTVTDAWEKRKQKGLLITIGDEPCLRTLPARAVEEIMGVKPQASFTDKELLEKAQETYDVYHLHMLEGSAGLRSLNYWRNMLGQNCIEVPHHMDVPKIIIDLVKRHASESVTFLPNTGNVVVDTPTTADKEEEILL
jgi:hypothetical protein